MSEETKKKIADALRGRAPKNIGSLSQYWLGKKRPNLHSDDTKKTLSEARKGEKSHLWRGGITKENSRIRKSLEYRMWRDAVFKRDGWACVWCGVRGGKLNADHIKTFARHPELRLDVDNGRTLCVSCHKTTPSYNNRWYCD